MNALGPRLRSLRLSRQWSQEQMGLELGVTKATVSKWESGRSLPDLPTLVRLRQLLGTTAFSLDRLIDEAPLTTAEPAPAYDEHHRPHAVTAQERDLLGAFRRLNPTQRRALLQLLSR